MLSFIRALAAASILVHGYLSWTSVTDTFNWFFIGVAVLVIAIPGSRWPFLLLPALLMIAGFVTGTYLIIARCIA